LLDYGIDNQQILVRFPAKENHFFLFQSVQIGPRTYVGYYTMGSAKSSPWSKAAGVWCRPFAST